MTGKLKSIFNPEKILVIHIMKTAGTSLRHMLEKEYRSQLVYPGTYFLSRFPNGWYPSGSELIKDYKNLPKHKVLIGHFTAALIDMLPRSYRSAVFLREPVQRSLSMLGHFSRTLRIPVRELIEDSLFMSTHIADYQTKILGANLVHNPDDVRGVDDGLFNLAQERIKKINFIGITENFAESCQIFDCIFNTKLSRNIRQDNVFRPEGGELSEYIDRIEPFIERDKALYKSAQVRFNRDWQFYTQQASS